MSHGPGNATTSRPPPIGRLSRPPISASQSAKVDVLSLMMQGKSNTAIRIGVRDGQLTISLFLGSHAMRKVRVSIVIPLLTLSALAGLQGWSYTAGERVAASALRLSGTTGQEALNIVSLAGKDIDIGNN